MDTAPNLHFFSSTIMAIPLLLDYILLAVLLLILLINTIISGAEAAFFTLSDEDKECILAHTHRRDAAVWYLLKTPKKLQAAIIMFYNSMNITGISLFIVLLRRWLHLPFFSFTQLALLASFSIIVLCFVEFIPKLYVTKNKIGFVRKSAPLIQLIYKLGLPGSSIVVALSNAMNRNNTQRKHEISMDEISKALEITTYDTSYEQEKDMLEGIIRFKDKTVGDVFISRTNMVAIEVQTSFRDVIARIVDAGFSRIPIYEETPDNIKGVLYVKDLLPHLDKQNSFHWQTLVRPAYFVPATKRIDDLLEEFRTNKNHMAIVVDEYGGTTGLITMEDILEEIVGDISDEYDEEEPLYTMAPDGSYIFEGITPLDEFIKIVGASEKEFEKFSDEVDTIAGMLLELKGNFPTKNEVIEFNQHRFETYEMNKRQILKVRYISSQKPDKTTEA